MVMLQLRAAATLRTSGKQNEAARAERFAARTRLILEEPKATRHMHALTRALYESSSTEVLLDRALEGAMSLVRAEIGNVQLSELLNGRLRIGAHCGFDGEFLEYFAVVEDDRSACGRAASRGSQTVIVDVDKDPAFAPHREIAAASRFRAVQSTPLVDPTGRLRGVISTHYRHPHRPRSHDLELMQWYAEHVGAALADRHSEPTALYEAIVALHAKSAELRSDAAILLNHSADAFTA
jgi:GAF domain-containing protein